MGRLPALVEKESDTRAHQLLTQSAILPSVDLGALIIEVFILNKRAELGRKKVIGTGKRIERQVCVTSPTASVDRNVTSYRVPDLNTRRFGVITADPRTQIRLELLISRRESQNEVRQERAGIDPGRHVGVASCKLRGTVRARRERLVQGEVSPASEAIIKEIAFNRRPNYPCTKDVTEFDAAKETDVIFRAHFESRSEKLRIRIIVRKRSVATAVLIDIGPRVDRTVKAESIHWWWRRRNLLVDLLSGLGRNGKKSSRR